MGGLLTVGGLAVVGAVLCDVGAVECDDNIISTTHIVGGITILLCACTCIANNKMNESRSTNTNSSEESLLDLENAAVATYSTQRGLSN